MDGRADVYSLALVLYEALSGTVPFVSDTTQGTIMARIGSPLPPNDALGPLDDVLARAAAPEASARLDAAGFAARLGALASALPTPEPLVLHPPDHVAPAPLNGFRPPAVSELTQVPPPSGRRPSRLRSAPRPGRARSSTPSPASGQGPGGARPRAA